MTQLVGINSSDAMWTPVIDDPVASINARLAGKTPTDWKTYCKSVATDLQGYLNALPSS